MPKLFGGEIVTTMAEPMIALPDPACGIHGDVQQPCLKCMKERRRWDRTLIAVKLTMWMVAATAVALILSALRGGSP